MTFPNSVPAVRVALLARVSTEGQADAERHSMPAQLRAMRVRVEREGWVIARVFEAPGESASTRDLRKRPVLGELVEAARRGEFDLVLFHESSRLARDEELSQWLINELQSLGVRLVEADKPVDYFYSPDGRVHYGIQSVLNAWQSRKHGAQVSKGKREMFEAGLPVGDVPFGYERPLRELADGTRLRDASVALLVVAEEAKFIRRAFEWRLAGIGGQEMAERFNAAGLRPHSKVGNRVFTSSGIESLLDNDFYCGFVRFKGERKVGVHEPVISEELWLSVQQRRLTGRMAVRSRNARALSGVATCAGCMGPLWLTYSGNVGDSRRPGYYRETSRLRGRVCANQGTGWRAEDAEAVVSSVISSMALDEAWVTGVDREARRVVRGDGFAGERAQLEGERRRATRAYVAGQLPEDEWQRITGAIDGRLAGMPSGLPGGVVFGMERLKSVGRVWAGMTEDERREGVRLLFESVVMDTRAKRMWLKPWAEVEEVFRLRRGYVGLAPPVGFEPTTSRVEAGCSIP